MSFYEALQANTNNVRYDVNFDDINVNTINGNTPPAIVGTGAQNDIPKFNDPLLAPPVLVDSGMSIESFSVPFLPLPLQANVLNLNPSIGINTIVTSVHDPNTSSDLMFVGSGAFSGSADLAIGNNSTDPARSAVLFNLSPNGYMNVNADNVQINENVNNNSIILDSNGISIYDNGNNNGLNSSSLGLSMFENTGSNFMFMDNATGFTLSNSAGASNMSLNGGITTINSNLNVTISQVNQGHFISLGNPTGVNIASNSLQDLSLNTDGNLHIKANSSTGNAGDVLTADGSTNAKWQSQPHYSYAYASINAVPAGAGWSLWIGAVPFDDGTLSYGGYSNSRGSDINYNSTTHKWTVSTAGIYQVLVIMNINLTNGVPTPMLTNSRIQLLNSALVQQGYDSGRFETTAGMIATGMLSYNVQFNFIGSLIADDYTINLEDSAGGGLGGALIGKASCYFSRIG